MQNDLSQYSRAQLARLGREYMAAAQLNSRTGYAALRMNHGDEAYKPIAIDNWLAASPIYTRRMQVAMGFAGGDDVATIFKGLQLECGFSHQYFDVHFEVSAVDKGRFWLASCGPLLETEPRGNDAVKTMCHDIEDPTFDATAIATNPRARMRPVHRPPRMPVDRAPHCEWNVFIDQSVEPLSEPEVTGKLRGSLLAQLEILRPDSDLEPGGMAYYNGAVYEQLHLEQLSHSALVLVCKELALQVNLLVKGLTMATENYYGRPAAQDVAQFQMLGSAWVIAERLALWADVNDGGIDAIIAVLAVHPLFQPVEYQQIKLQRENKNSVILTLGQGCGQQDAGTIGWLNLPPTEFTNGLDALVKGVDGRASCTQLNDNEQQWLIEIGDENHTTEEPLPVQIAKGTVLYQTKFKDRLQLLQVEA